MDELREKLAELAHDQWSGWIKFMFMNWTPDNIMRWYRQINTPYSELPEWEKESDRKEADRIIEIIKSVKKDA